MSLIKDVVYCSCMVVLTLSMVFAVIALWRLK